MTPSPPDPAAPPLGAPTRDDAARADLQRLQLELEEKRRRCALMYPPAPLKTGADAAAELAAELAARVEAWKAGAIVSPREALRARLRIIPGGASLPTPAVPTDASAPPMHERPGFLGVASAVIDCMGLPRWAVAAASKHRAPVTGDTRAAVDQLAAIAREYTNHTRKRGSR